MATREQLIRVVLDLPEDEIDPTLEFIASRHQDPLVRLLYNAPEDDEPWTDEDEAAAAEGRADIAAGRTVSLDEAMREFG